MNIRRKTGPIQVTKLPKRKAIRVEVKSVNSRIKSVPKAKPKRLGYQNLDEATIFPLITDSTYELSPSSSLDATVLYREFRLKVMLNITSLVRECCKAKQISSHC